jgi:MinD superfamily P-loop ATPase
MKNGDFQMQVSIASGKGGTGKTTVATNLALLIAVTGETIGSRNMLVQ